MKKLSVIMALVIAIFVSSNAQAASWVQVDTRNDITTSIDKDTIKRGTDSKEFPKFNRKDGYSAICKLEMKLTESETFTMTWLVSFYEKNGERLCCMLDGYDGTPSPENESKVIEEKVDLEGRVWPEVWTYIEKNLK